MRRWRPAPLLVLGFLLAACDARLPEPESDGAKLYKARCSTGCHRVYAPTLLKYEMWKMKIDSMQGEMARRGALPLSDREKTIVLDYLRRFSGG